MPVAVVVSADGPSDLPFLGRSVALHWQAVLAEAGLGRANGPGPLVAVDGRYAALAPESLRNLVEPGMLVTPAGSVVAVALPFGDPARGAALLVGVDGPSQSVSPEEALAIDVPWERALAERAIVDRHLRRLAAVGVRLIDPARIWIEPGVRVAAGATLWGGCVLRGRTRVGAGAVVMAGVWLEDTEVGVGSVIRPHTVCEGAMVGPSCAVGPSAHLRGGAVLEEDVKVGNFVEVKKAHLARGVRASHLTYLGDAVVGEGANVGAGTITCNYDGFGKYQTVIGAGAFVGSNSSLVAPVRIGAGAIVGAGSTIGADVPDDALVVERAGVRTFEGRASTLRERNRRRAENGKDRLG